MSYLICFWDKSKIQVNEETANQLKHAISNKLIDYFMIGESLYAVSGVEKIIPKYEAFDIFPSEFEALKAMKDKTATLPALADGKNLLKKVDKLTPVNEHYPKLPN